MVRANEIFENDEEIENKNIQKIFTKYFAFSGKLEIKNSVISVFRDTMSYSRANVKMVKPATKFPVKFGEIDGYFAAIQMGLETLEGGPWAVETFKVNNNKLKTLEHGPGSVIDDYVCYNNPLISLEGFPEHVTDSFNPCITFNKDLPLLRLLQYSYFQIYDVDNFNDTVQTLLWKYRKGQEGSLRQRMTSCAKELRANGFEGNAKW